MVFLFVGGGSEFPKIKEAAAKEKLPNVRCLPYEPMTELGGSLSAADLHVVSLGDPYVGIIHPCKIYNILSVEAPVLYLGPKESHISDIFQCMGKTSGAIKSWYSAPHDDVQGMLECLRTAMNLKRLGKGRGDAELYGATARRFSQASVLPRQVELVEELGILSGADLERIDSRKTLRRSMNK